MEIDREEYENNDKCILVDPHSPKLNKLQVKCLSDNQPQEVSTRFSSPAIQNPQILVNKDSICIQLCQAKYYSYIVNRTSNGKNEEIYNGKWKESITDSPERGNYVYTVIPYYDDGKTIYSGQPVTLPQVNFNPSSDNNKIPDIAYKDWFNQ